MSTSKRLWALGAVLVTIAVGPVSTPSVWPQSKYKMLHEFTRVHKKNRFDPLPG